MVIVVDDVCWLVTVLVLVVCVEVPGAVVVDVCCVVVVEVGAVKMLQYVPL